MGDRCIEVPLLDLKVQFRLLKSEVGRVIDEVCESQRFILGDHVSGLENEISSYCGVDFGIGVSSGTDALLLALMVLDIGVGDEVITSPYTFFSTAGAIARTGARPVFCDIDPVTYNLSPSLLEEIISRDFEFSDGQLFNVNTGGLVKALIPVHLYGQLADMDSLMEVARKFNLKVIEDAAQAIGSAYPDGCRAGSFGDIGCFSFFPSKNLGAFGDGGMCVCNDPVLAGQLRIMRVHGGDPKYYHAFIGGNFRLDELQAAVLRVKLRYLDGWTEARQRNAAFYDQAFAAGNLGDQLSTPVVLEGYRHIYNQYIIRVKRRDALRKYLAERHIGTEIYYPIPLHMQKCFDYLGYKPDDCRQSKLAGEETLALPIYPELTEAQLSYVVEMVTKFYQFS